MKTLPAIDSTVAFKNDWGNYVDATIQAHFEDKAIFTYQNLSGSIRVDMAIADCFHEFTPRIRQEQQLTNLGLSVNDAKKVLALNLQTEEPVKVLCPSTDHNYTPAGFMDGAPAFVCTKCGDAIKVL